MELISEIPCDLRLLCYSQKWDAFVTNKFYYYRIVNNRSSKKINTSQNYINDQNYVPSRIRELMYDIIGLFVLLIHAK